MNAEQAPANEWTEGVFRWDDAPSGALWYGEVIGGREGETDYWSGYSAADEPPDVLLLLPEGWQALESTVAPTPNNPDHGNLDATERIEYP